MIELNLEVKGQGQGHGEIPYAGNSTLHAEAYITNGRSAVELKCLASSLCDY